MFELKNVSYTYDSGVVALRNVSFKVEKGRSVAIMGANGCGKSTLLKLLNGLISPNEGEYYFNETIIDKSALADSSFAKSFHRRVGFVVQNADAQLFCGIVEDEVAFGPRQLDLTEEDCRRRVDDCLKMLDIEELRERAPYTLSGGEKRKVAFACVLALNPDALVSDEPLENLDEKGRVLILELFHALKTAGKTLIFATHNATLASELADERIVMEQGRVAKVETLRP